MRGRQGAQEETVSSVALSLCAPPIHTCSLLVSNFSRFYNLPPPPPPPLFLLSLFSLARREEQYFHQISIIN